MDLYDGQPWDGILASQVIMNLPEQPKLRSTANHVVGRYSRWIRNNGTCLEVSF